MNNDDGSYERYRQAEAELAEELDERCRAAEDAAEWEETRRALRELGTLDYVESRLHKIRRAIIRGGQNSGKSRYDATLEADLFLARARKALRRSPNAGEAMVETS